MRREDSSHDGQVSADADVSLDELSKIDDPPYSVIFDDSMLDLSLANWFGLIWLSNIVIKSEKFSKRLYCKRAIFKLDKKLM